MLTTLMIKHIFPESCPALNFLDLTTIKSIVKPKVDAMIAKDNFSNLITPLFLGFLVLYPSNAMPESPKLRIGLVLEPR